MARSFLPSHAPDEIYRYRPLKILHIISSVDAAGGGPIEAVTQLASVSTYDGHEVEVASLDAPGAPHLKGFPLPVYPLGPGRLAYGYSARFLRWLRENARNYDAGILNGLWQDHSFCAWRPFPTSGTPYFSFTHGILDPWFARP